MVPALDELLLEAHESRDRFWFVQAVEITERTDTTITVRFMIGPDLFVQAFLSQNSGRLSFALVGPSGRLCGCDRERETRHRHPFGQPDQHEPIPEGVSARPLTQFMAEVAVLLIEHDLI